MTEDPEMILGVEANASSEEIRAAYLDKVKQFPPERDPEKFEKIRDAYQLMCDPRSRAKRLFFSRGPETPLDALFDALPQNRRFTGPEPWLKLLRPAPHEQESR